MPVSKRFRREAAREVRRLRRMSELRPGQFTDESWTRAKRQYLSRLIDVSNGIEESMKAGQRLGTMGKALIAMQSRPDNKFLSLEHALVRAQGDAASAAQSLTKYVRDLDR